MGSHDEMSIVVQMWLANEELSMEKIAERVKAEYGLEIDGDRVHQRIREARSKKRLHYIPEPDAQLQTEIRTALKIKPADHSLSIHVLNTAVLQPVAVKIAEEIIHIIDQRKSQKDIHVGFYGGRTNSLVAHAMSEHLADADSARPKKPDPEKQKTRGLHFHSLVGMLDAGEPETDPNAFPIYFQKDKVFIENYLERNPSAF